MVSEQLQVNAELSTDITVYSNLQTDLTYLVNDLHTDRLNTCLPLSPPSLACSVENLHFVEGNLVWDISVLLFI